MKTLMNTFALALALTAVSATATLANPITRPTTTASFKTGIYSTQTGALRIALDKQKGGLVDISLKSVHGRVLYSQRLTKNEQTYRKLLNLSDLEDGVYQLEITNGVETTTQTITIATQQPNTPSRVISIK